MSGRMRSWPVPFVRQLQGEFVPGQSAFLQGFITGNQRFDINLSTSVNATSANVDDDIPLHISVRMTEGKIVLNSHVSGAWGKEERVSNPFKMGEEFDLRIRAHDQNFRIFANGKEVATYDFRLPLPRVQYVCIWGDVELYRVSWEGRYYPVPFQTVLPEGFGSGKVLYLSGVVNERADKFAVNLLLPNGDIALHFNPRFGEKKVVRNSQMGGKWDAVEEREGDFPFQKARTFDVIIQSQPDAFYVYVNGKEFCSYVHRLPASEIQALMIDGDVELQGVHW